MSELLALIIEDDLAIAGIYEEALHLAAYKTETIENGRLAIQRIQEIVPALILLDLHLPEVTGEEVLNAIRSTPALSETTVFITTADHLFAEQLRAEVDLVLLKPISLMQLRDMALRFRP
jgi:two-component system repressor protein LuxO